MSGVEVLSEAGLNCTFFAPAGLNVTKAGDDMVAIPTRRVAIGETAGLPQFETEKGGRYLIDLGLNHTL